jgi:hypothetical protein
MGKRVWWKDEKVGEVYILQSHILTGHLRIIDHTDALHYYNADRGEAETRFSALENSAKME